MPFFIGAGIKNEEVSATTGELKLPIVMYHQVLKSTNGKYTVTPTQLESDFRAILDAGFTPVFMSEVINWVDGKGSLPAKPIVITFDDGNYNNIFYGLPIAKELGVKFMINPVTSFSQHSVDHKDTENPNYSHIAWWNMKDAHDTGLVEFGNHTHKMHKFRPRFGISKIAGENDDEYRTALNTDIEEAQSLLEKCGLPRPLTFAYPFGKYSTEARDHLVEMGFRAMLTCNEHITTIKKGDPTSLYTLGRYNRDGAWSTNTLMQKIKTD